MSNSKPEKMIYHNRSSTDYGIFINFPEPYVFAQKEFTPTHVPGRSGDVIEDNMAYQNPTLTVSFTVVRPERYNSWFAWKKDIAKWLDAYDYDYLKFTYQEDYVWLAYPNGAPTINEGTSRSADGSFSFTVKPYVLKASGIDLQDVPFNKGTVTNSETMECYPDWKIVTGGTNDSPKTFTLTVNDMTYQFNAVTGTVFVDGENCQVSNESGSINSEIMFTNNDSPRLEPGENTIAISGDSVQKIQWKPNWRCII